MAPEAADDAEAAGPDDEPSDRALLAAHVAGEPDAFGRLFARHRDRLWAVALRTTGDREQAADGLQDAMVAAFRRAGSYRGDAAVTTWLHRVVVNACLDRLRAASVRRAEPLPDAPPADGLVAAATGPVDPVDASVAGDRRRRVLAALATLPPDQRAALVLVDMEAYPVAEVAVMLDCAPGTVKSRCHRGRQRLAALLADLVGPEADDDVTPAAGNPEPGPDVPTPSGPRAPPDGR